MAEGKPSLYNESVNFEDKINRIKSENNKEIDKMFGLFVGLVVFVTVTFLIFIVTTSLDSIKDKELYLNYNKLYKEYFDKSFEQNEKILKLEYKLELLKAKNSYLK